MENFSFKVACIRENGAELIIVPTDAEFGRKPMQEKKKIILHLQSLVWSNGVSGRVVPVWDAGDGKMGFIAPPQWHAFFHSIDLPVVAACLNREICWPPPDTLQSARLRKSRS